MKIGLYQMINQGDISRNFSVMEQGVIEAFNSACKVVVFPECALTGYPPIETQVDLNSIKDDVALFEEKLKQTAKKYNINIIFGTIRFENDKRFNTLKVIDQEGHMIDYYDKRALWGYDLQNFQHGQTYKSIIIDDVKIGLSICFEIRFPEYYREHKNHAVDLMLTCFCDTSAVESPTRYNLIKGHIQTRAVENVIPHLSVNSASKFQSAPTGIYDIYGNELMSAHLNVNQLLIYAYQKQEVGYGAKGILEISKNLSKNKKG